MGGAAIKERHVIVDALKALAIAMVVVTHLLNLRPEFRSVAPGLVDIMTAFNMPLFVFLSGYVLRPPTNVLGFMRGKALALLVPYIAWVAVALPVRHVPVGEWLPRMAQSLIDPRAGFQMWFLWVLFVLFAIFALERLVRPSDARSAVVAVALGGLALLPLPEVFGIDKIAWLYPFLIAGYLTARLQPSLKRFDFAATVVGAIGFPLLLVVGSSDAVWRFPTAFAGIAAVWGIYRLLPAVALEAQAWVGQRTLGVYGAQMIALPFLMVGSGWLGATASTVTVLAGCLTLTLALDQVFASRALFLGRWPKGRR